MERFIRFTAFVLLMAMATAIAIAVAGGHPFRAVGGWQGWLALGGLLFAVAIVFGGLWALGKNHFDPEVLLGIAGAGTAAILLLAWVGLKWLTSPLSSLAAGGGIWWPLVVLTACVVAWFTRLPRR